MVRTVLYLLLSIILLTFLRAVIGLIGRAMSDLMNPAPKTRGGESAAKPSGPPPKAGELRKDPVCGTYVPADSAIQKAVGGTVYYFCSTACRDKYKAG